MTTRRWILVPILFLALGAAPAPPAVLPPGDPFQPPELATAPGAPLIYEHSGEAGPDQTFFLVGEGLTDDVTAWGVSADRPGGQEWKLRVQLHSDHYLAATLPENAHDGPFIVRVRNKAGASAPIVLNAPQPWWCGPDAEASDPRPFYEAWEGHRRVRVFGRNLARRPDFARAFVYVCPPGKPGVWADIVQISKHSVAFCVPPELAKGDYEVWFHAGAGGRWGWGGPLPLKVRPEAPEEPEEQFDRSLKPGATGQEIQRVLDAKARKGGGTVLLSPGTYSITTTLRIPSRVRLRNGKLESQTTIQLVRDPTVSLPRLGGGGWDQAPGRVHTPGDLMEYQVEVPKAGTWNVWLRYATDMAGYNQPGVSGNHTIAVDDSPGVPLMNLENTGGWGSFRWSKAAAVTLPAGRHRITWRNVKGGGVSLDALVFALDPAFAPKPRPAPPPVSAADVLVVQAEDCARFVTKEGELPGGDRAVIWLQGDGAALYGLTVLGDSRTNIGIAVRSPDPLRWVNDVSMDFVNVADIDGKKGENCAVHVRYVDRFHIDQCTLWGRVPLFLSGARRSEFTENSLLPVTRFGGNAEAAILGRTETVERCIIEGNAIASPAGSEAGGPTTRRLLWLSTGHGSVSHNFIANNGVSRRGSPRAYLNPGPPRFGGVAGTDQNVGEMILFEGNHRTMYFGPLAGADAASVTLPATIPPTPAGRLGSVTRKELAHDAAGNETPFWPPDVDDGTDEPPIGEYYVTVFSGRGQGQTRRVMSRQGTRLKLDRDWSVPPAAGSVVAVGTGFYRNLIVGNYTPDGMTGVQLWISCIENVVAGNSIARQRKPGLFFYANGTTLASSMPRTWNRGISPLFWNVAEGNSAEECSAGALVTSGDEGGLPVEFPRALGNVLRHNSFVRSRTDGVVLTGGGAAGGKGTSASVVGTIVEFNVVRDALTAYHAGGGSDAVVFRRNHAYFWYPVNRSTAPPVAFAVDDPGATFAVEQNSIEGIHGVWDGAAVDLRTPKGDRRLPQ
jgi:hypothetical protein